MKTKAQAEMIGLLVIVLLFIFIGLFFLMFSLKPGSGTITLIREDAETTNLHSALLKATTPCEHKSIKSLLKDCYESKEIILCNQKICDYTALEVSKAINLTLDEKKEYEYTVIAENTTILSIGSPCTGKTFVDSRNIISSSALLELTFKTCLP